MKFDQQRKRIVTALLFASVVFLTASVYINQKQDTYRDTLLSHIAEQDARLIRLAELIDADRSDSVVNQIIKDCMVEDRARFDNLLSQLSQLRYVELTELDRLFESCADYFSSQKLILVSRLEREFELRQDFIELLNSAGLSVNNQAEKHFAWQELVELEVERSNLTRDLVDFQGEIIDLLATGNTVNSDSVVEITKQAQTVKDKISIQNIHADELRQQIISL